MPPRIKGTKSKLLKENITVGNKTKQKSSVPNTTMSTRKALADKTNSTSDDNASVVHSKQKKKQVAAAKSKLGDDLLFTHNARSGRERRLPIKYAESEVLKYLSRSQNDESPKRVSSKCKVTPNKIGVLTEVSPFKTPQKRQHKTPEKLETSLLVKRPKRICRLPSKFDDHSVSPVNKFVPVQPCHASTPIAQKTSSNTKSSKPRVGISISPAQKALNSKKLVQTSITEKFCEKNNNTAKNVISKKKNICQNKAQSPVTQKEKKNLSFKNLGTKKIEQTANDSYADVYEFTFDPKDEPHQPKKKRKRVVKKKPAQPKTFVFKNNYDKNISKALSALKSVVGKKTSSASTKIPETQLAEKSNAITSQVKALVKNVPLAAPASNNKSIVQKPSDNTSANNTVHNHQSVRIEDIAANLESSVHDDINYSPINSPNNQNNPEIPNDVADKNTNDPLNLREESFFDEPIASSSMNVSVRHPDASPWRPDFNELPIKWQVNSYVKASMTPAVECSYINSGDIVKKHVYTNMVAESNDSLAQIVDTTPNLKQTSIISFIKEVVQRSAKKKRGVSVTPTKNNSIFDDISVTDKQVTPVKGTNRSKSSENSLSEVSAEGSRKRKNDSDEIGVPAKNPCTDKDGTLFGFDDSEDLDQENMPPRKNLNKNRLKSLRPRAKTVLKEINKQSGPMRAEIPLAVKTKLNSEIIDKVYDKLKTAALAPTFPESNVEQNNVSPSFSDNEMDDDSQSVHLFEDIEVVHHLKPTRKSYGKSRKVTFRQRSTSDSDAGNTELPELADSEAEDLSDLSFQVPSVKQKKAGKKKMTKKQKLTKKEEQEADAWAAGFNSMCEDIDEFDLVVE